MYNEKRYLEIANIYRQINKTWQCRILRKWELDSQSSILNVWTVQLKSWQSTYTMPVESPTKPTEKTDICNSKPPSSRCADSRLLCRNKISSPCSAAQLSSSELSQCPQAVTHWVGTLVPGTHKYHLTCPASRGDKHQPSFHCMSVTRVC